MLLALLAVCAWMIGLLRWGNRRMHRLFLQPAYSSAAINVAQFNARRKYLRPAASRAPPGLMDSRLLSPLRFLG
jgi:hypothetical protein